LGNHYHLLLEMPDANLVAGMEWVQGASTQRYNRRHRCFGHLLQGGYAASLEDRVLELASAGVRKRRSRVEHRPSRRVSQGNSASP